MTFVTPLMISLSAGVFEFGNLIHQKLLIEAGLRDAARYAARCNSAFYTEAGLTIDCAGNAENIAVYGNPAGTGPTRVAEWSTADVTVNMTYLTVPVTTDADGNQNYRSSGTSVYTVRVDTSFTYAGTSLLAYLGLSPITLAASHEERSVGW
jgi:Flp pilus assembly protein TadG